MPDTNDKVIKGVKIKAITSFNKEIMAFLCQLYTSTRWQEVMQTPWDDQQKLDFLKQQFQAQHQHYQSHYPNADYQLLMKGDDNIGRIYIDRDLNSICLIDIALLPEYRNDGIGSQLLLELLSEAQSTNKKIVIHVENYNPAYQWYKRHGFKQVEDKGVYQYMEWYPKKSD